MSDWSRKLQRQLDEDFPNWWIWWATQNELTDAVALVRQTGDKASVAELQKEQLSRHVATRLFHIILHAAIGAGLVEEKRS